MEKTDLSALVFGSSGLTGNFLTEKLLSDPSFSQVKVFVRKKSGTTHPKLKEIIVDFANEKELQENLKGDVLFCCLGTTIRVAGSQEAFEKVDLHYPVLLANLAAKNGIKKFLMVSSVGASAQSTNFYLKTKGTAEEKIAATTIPHIYFFRPSMLLGKRKEFRFGEVMGKFFMVALSFLFMGGLKKYRAIKSEKVAEAMIRYSKTGTDKLKVVEYSEIVE
ncbi:MAG: NAD(P)H-binding protein [Bacteroidia bacterium]|nr:NAD(P)H-binding protein [Bacteroidia bacterium]